MSRGFGAIVAGGVVATVVWAFTKQAQQEAEAANVVLVREPTQRDTKNALFGAIFQTVLSNLDDGVFDQVTGSGQSGTVFIPPATTQQAATQARSGSGDGAQGLLDMIARYEGGVNGYDVVYGGSRIQPPRPLTQMTVQEVRDWQDRSVRAGSASSAVGKYQIIRRTLDSLIADGTLSRAELFDVDAQERAGRSLLNRRGYQSYQSGQISETTFAQRLAQEWASLPVPVAMQGHKRRVNAGQSYYAGDGLNNAHYSVSDLMNAVRSLG